MAGRMVVVDGGERKSETRERDRRTMMGNVLMGTKARRGNKSEKAKSNLIKPYSNKRLVERTSSDKLLLIGSNGKKKGEITH